ncbi:MAG: hypothetical protein H8D23_31790 [Candidatus Brocadiales bacterium]|nr:hypothetical protein [Candidatus Brocadiales bacterium]
MKILEVLKLSDDWLLLEAAGKNTHMTHIEDLVFIEGRKGAEAAIEFVDGVRNMLAQNGDKTTQVSVKWDGAPALVCGIDPVDNQFFVGTKSVFSKTSKLVKSVSDLTTYGYEGELRNKLALALKHLSKLGIQGVLQGDMMYTKNDLSIEELDSKKFYMFRPNTITYAVPVNSNLGKRIKDSQLGIIFHTSYDGETVPGMTATFGADVNSLTHTKDVWFDDAFYKDLSGIASLTDNENNKLIDDIKATKAAIAKANFDIVNSDLEPMFMQYINSRIRQDQPQIANLTEFAHDFVEWYKEYMQKQISKLKNQDPESKAVKNRLDKVNNTNDTIKNNLEGIVSALAVYKDFIALKTQLLNKLNKIDSISTLVKTETGYKVVNPEGFVAIGHEGEAVKLVDRLEFSKQNFNAVKNWTK